MKTEITFTDDGSPTVRIIEQQITYHSRNGALAESKHVFIEHGLKYAHQRFGSPLHVLEVGLGTGLNAALTLQQNELSSCKIHYEAIEKFPLGSDLLDQYAAAFDTPVKETLLKIKNCPAGHSTLLTKYFSFKKVIADFTIWQPSTGYHLVYFDAFAPLDAPEMWEESCFNKLKAAMIQGGVLVTYCAQGEVRRRMRRAGFKTERLPGAPGKFEMTRAICL